MLHICSESLTAGDPGPVLPPLRSCKDESVLWQPLKPLDLRGLPLLHKRRRGPKPLVLQPSFGGKKKKSRLTHTYTLPPEPTEFHMGHGPHALGYYQRPDHLRCNRTKNRHPLQSKRRSATRTCSCCFPNANAKRHI